MVFNPRIARRFVDVRMEGEAWKALPEAELEQLSEKIAAALDEYQKMVAEIMKAAFPTANLVIEVE